MLIIGLYFAGLFLAVVTAYQLKLVLDLPMYPFIAVWAGLTITISTGIHDAARDSGAAEARAVERFYAAARSAPPPFEQRLHGAAVCYARAVAGPEWAAMAAGERASASSDWTGTHPGGIRRTLANMTPAAAGFARVQRSDAVRSQRREERLARVDPDFGWGLPLAWLFVVYGLIVFIGGIAFARGRLDLAQPISVLAFSVVAQGVVILMVIDINPYSGLFGIGPSAMEATEQRGTAAHQAAYRVAPPCDGDGRPAPYLLRLRGRP